MIIAYFTMTVLAMLGWRSARRRAREGSDLLADASRLLDQAEQDLAFKSAEVATLKRDLAAAHLAVLGRRSAAVGVRRHGLPRLVKLSAEDVAFLRRDAMSLAQYLCDACEPATDEQRAHRAVMERRLNVQLRIIGERQ